MEGFAGLLIVLAIGLLVTGPVAVILAIVLFNKLDDLHRRVSRIEYKGYEPPLVPPPIPTGLPTVESPEETYPPPGEPETEMVPAEAEPSVEAVAGSVPSQTQEPLPPPIRPPIASIMDAIKPPQIPGKETPLEVKIGITAALVIGVIIVIFAVGFFLKYMIENATFPPLARVCMVAVGGFVALVFGEIIRRRDYGIVAKGITALGFALLYAAVFSGNKVYGLIDTPWAFAGAIVITAAAMLYAVGLDEVLVAFLSLLGGYLTPIIITTGRNLPIHLFGYVLVLSVGAMAAGAFRRWRAINWMAFAGTYILYTLWFDEFYRDSQMMIGLVWLGVFAGVYLLLPILHSLLRKVLACGEDIVLLAANSIVVFYYLWRMLYTDYQKELALTAAALGVVHLVMMAAAAVRCREDVNLQAVLGVMGTAFVTAAIPLYFARLQPALIGWAIESVVLTFIVIRYRSLWTQAIAIIVSGLATAGLFYHLPLHESGDFKPFINEPFGTWLFVALSMMACHGLWRFLRDREDEEAGLLAQIYYAWGRLLLAAGAALEWYAHCDWHIEYLKQEQAYILMGMMVIASILSLGFFLRPICPKGEFVRTVGLMSAVVGAVYVAMAMSGVYYHRFTLFANWPFALAGVYAAAIFLSAWSAKYARKENAFSPSGFLVLLGLILLWVVLSEEIYLFWYCGHEYGSVDASWAFRAQMYLSVAWAIYAAVLLVLGFLVKARGIRYLSLAIFAVLLGKIFLIDTTTLRTEYRIAAFLTTGLVLVGVSFLYQFLRKKGFFDTLETTLTEQSDTQTDKGSIL